MRIGTELRRRLGMATLVLAGSAPAAIAQDSVAPKGAETLEAGVHDDRQPGWTGRPAFGETDVYVLPKGVSLFVFALRPTTAHSGSTTTESAYRAEFGLPARFQLGVHATGHTASGDDAIGNIDAQALEIRWGLAEWGRMWGNPAVHAEWREASRGADVGTVALLLGGGASNGWRWGTNLAWTHEASGRRQVARAWTAGVSYGRGSFASLGVETRLAFVDQRGSDSTRTAMARELLAGPSVQIRPVRRMFITLAPLFGTSASSPRSRTTLAAGWQF